MLYFPVTYIGLEIKYIYLMNISRLENEFGRSIKECKILVDLKWVFEIKINYISDENW